MRRSYRHPGEAAARAEKGDGAHGAVKKCVAGDGSGRAPAGRDLLGPFAEALREKGLKVGFYFSHIDWNHPDYATVGNDDDPDGAARGWNEYAHAPKGEEEPLRWERFREQYHAQYMTSLIAISPICCGSMANGSARMSSGVRTAGPSTWSVSRTRAGIWRCAD